MMKRLLLGGLVYRGSVHSPRHRATRWRENWRIRPQAAWLSERSAVS